MFTLHHFLRSRDTTDLLTFSLKKNSFLSRKISMDIFLMTEMFRALISIDPIDSVYLN